MSYHNKIEKKIKKFNPNEIIITRKFFSEELSGIPEVTFYKVLERMVKQNTLVSISKGVYCKPKKTRFGVIAASENDITRYFIGNNKNGIVIGYRLYNREGLTTQVAKTTELYSNLITEEKKTVKNVTILKLNMKLEERKVKIIETLEILQNYQHIEDMNDMAFASYLQNTATEYVNEAADEVLGIMKYKKSTIAFLEMVLNHFGVNNTLSKYLSGTSRYSIPRVEGIYEPAQ
jgi:hypothetical protein